MGKEKTGTKLCKHCKTEIPAAAKVCPNCRKKQGGVLKIVLIVIVALIIISAIAGGGSDKPKKVEKTPDANAASTTSDTTNAETPKQEDAKSAEKDETFTVGDTVDDNGLLVTLVSCDEYVSENEYITPEEGKKYIRLNFEIQNNSEDTANISSIVSFSAYADDYAIDQAYVDSSDKSLDGEVAVGKKMNGSIFYEVPVETATLQVDYISNFWTDRRTAFVINF